ncbi:endonuclease domain-containing protein [Solwaraspora sp. WMMB335]|uniref:endonuclease domain-containing protein n=1 Tax=Solwaraspora sp. WMMB335 TaxID=3404118 RepID=UPI003B94CCFD
MSRPATVPPELSFAPFSGSRAVAAGLLTWRMLSGPTWRRLLPDVYVHAAAVDPADHRMWCAAVAVRLPPGAAIHGVSAAYLWGVDLLPRNNRAHARVQVTVPLGARPRAHPRIAYARGVLDEDDRTSLTGLPLTTEVRTAFDLGRSLPHAEALGAVDMLLHRRLLRRDDITAYVDTHPGWRGIRQLREIVALAEPASASPMESRLRLLLYDAGLPRPTPQHEVRVVQRDRRDVAAPEHANLVSRGRFVARVDLAYPQWRIAIEYEGDHHRDRGTFRKDVHRYNELRAAGWLVLRFTADDVLRRSGHLVRQVRQAIAERAGR